MRLGLCVTPVFSHHSFAMYDQTKTVVLTGVAHQFVAQANHAELHFYVIGPDGKLSKDKDGKYIDWGVEMAGAAAVAQQGHYGGHVPRRHDIQRQDESSPGRQQFRIPGRRHRQMSLENSARSR